jgi:hypothetical protein
MARPKKDDDAKREHIVSLRCTEAEHTALAERAAAVGMTQSEYLRHMAVAGRVVVKHTQTDTELTTELRRIGVNLNQIARVLNTLPTGAPPALMDTLQHLQRVLFARMRAA